MAMITRMRIGATVQMISISVLWVVFEGLGLLLALNFTMTTINKARTKRVMIAVIGRSRKLWNQWMSSATGLAASWSPICHGWGWPSPAAAAGPDIAATANPPTKFLILPINLTIPRPELPGAAG